MGSSCGSRTWATRWRITTRGLLFVAFASALALVTLVLLQPVLRPLDAFNGASGGGGGGTPPSLVEDGGGGVPISAAERASLLRGGAGSTSVDLHEALSSLVGRWFYVTQLHPPELLAAPFAGLLPQSFRAASAAAAAAPAAFDDGAPAALSSSSQRKGALQPGDSFYEPRWEQAFQELKEDPSVLQEMGGSSSSSSATRLSITSTCVNIVLQSAPWCNFNVSVIADTLLLGSADEVQQPTSVAATGGRTADDETDGISDEEFVQREAAKAHAARDRVVANAQAVLRRASRLGSLNEADKEMLRRVRWQSWLQAQPPPPQQHQQHHHSSASSSGGGPPVEEFRVRSEDVGGDGAGGELFLHRTRRSYPLLLALRRTDDDADESSRDGARAAAPTDEQPYDKDDDLIGFHACMFGAKRNLSSTIERIVKNVLAHLRPQRFHVVSSDAGFEDWITVQDNNDSHDNKNGTEAGVGDAAGAAAAERAWPADTVAKARAAHFNDFLSLIAPYAASFVATKQNAATSAHSCGICRGFFPREVCRMSILQDLARGVPVELVMLFRPDMYTFSPLHLTPYTRWTPPVDIEHPTGAALMTATADVSSAAVISSLPTSKQQQQRSDEAPVPVTKWRLHTRPLFSLVVDKGFLPGAFGVINDVNISAHTVVVHCRVTFPMDLHWIGDPVLLGHWNVMNHWLEMFSITTSAPRLGWDERNSGELHHRDFYFKYIRPLFAAAPAVPRVEIKVFDFQFSLFRADPAINKQILSLPFNYAAYQQQTIFLKFATKWESAECMRYIFVAREFNVSSFYTKTLHFRGEIGKLKLARVAMRECQLVATPPGLQTCFTQYQRIIFYKKGRNIHNPCKPYCGVIPIMFREGLCLHVGNKGPKKKYLATFSVSPMIRNESGEVLRFNVVNPQYVRGDRHHLKKEWLLELGRKEKEREKDKEREQGLQLAAATAQTDDASASSRAPGREEEEEDKAVLANLAHPEPPGVSSPSPPLQQQPQQGSVFRRGSKKYRYVSRSRKG